MTKQNRAILENIRKHGWHCLHIAPDDDDQAPFTYSIGFTESHGAPEVMIFGLPQDKAHALLSACADHVSRSKDIRLNVEDPNILTGDYKVVFRPILPEHLDEYAGTAMRYYEDRPFRVVIMFLPDRQHRFPWHPDYSGMPADEPLAIVEPFSD